MCKPLPCNEDIWKWYTNQLGTKLRFPSSIGISIQRLPFLEILSRWLRCPTKWRRCVINTCFRCYMRELLGISEWINSSTCHPQPSTRKCQRNRQIGPLNLSGQTRCLIALTVSTLPIYVQCNYDLNWLRRKCHGNSFTQALLPKLFRHARYIPVVIPTTCAWLGTAVVRYHPISQYCLVLLHWHWFTTG